MTDFQKNPFFKDFNAKGKLKYNLWSMKHVKYTYLEW